MRCFDEMTSPIGQLTLVVDAGVVTFIAMQDQAHLPDRATFGSKSPGCANELKEQLSAYFAGDLKVFPSVAVAEGTEFQQSVWQALLTIPYGETSTYGAIAKQIGSPAAVRAVGGAIGRNPLSIVVPCHRVISANGNLTGYAGGFHRKLFLLRHEGVDI
jgi:methylated-DNA-[protein]-cysteine S-methyltransferase